MRLRNSLTPYPVLASFRDDYLDASFSTEVVAVQEFGNLRVNITFDLDEPMLQELMDYDLAEFAIHLESPSTSFRRCDRTRNDSYSISLDRNSVNDVIEVCTFVVASDDIEGFSSPNFHPDYGSVSFDINAGGVLAIGDSVVIKVESEDDLARHSSVINVMRANSGQKDAMSINTDQSDAILVSLRPELYDIYVTYGDGTDSPLFFSLVILPALQSVLTRMTVVKEGDPDADKEWFKSIVEILAREGLALSDIDNYSDDKSSLAIAQKLLGQPLEKSIKKLVKEA